jgi:hypothetical protein
MKMHIASWRLAWTVEVLASCGTRNKRRIPCLVASGAQWPAMLMGAC